MINPTGFSTQSSIDLKKSDNLNQKKLQQACTDFEAMMVKKLLESMTSNTKLFGSGSGFGGDFYQSMFQDSIAELVAKQGIGIGKMLSQQLDPTKGPVK